jgi:hypothetical protein
MPVENPLHIEEGEQKPLTQGERTRLAIKGLDTRLRTLPEFKDGLMDFFFNGKPNSTMHYAKHIPILTVRFSIGDYAFGVTGCNGIPPDISVYRTETYRALRVKAANIKTHTAIFFAELEYLHSHLEDSETDSVSSDAKLKTADLPRALKDRQATDEVLSAFDRVVSAAIASKSATEVSA